MHATLEPVLHKLAFTNRPVFTGYLYVNVNFFIHCFLIIQNEVRSTATRDAREV